MVSVADPKGVQGVRWNPLPTTVFLISNEKEIIWSSTKLFHFLGIYLYYSVDFTFLSFGIMGFVVEL